MRWRDAAFLFPLLGGQDAAVQQQTLLILLRLARQEGSRQPLLDLLPFLLPSMSSKCKQLRELAVSVIVELADGTPIVADAMVRRSEGAGQVAETVLRESLWRAVPRLTVLQINVTEMRPLPSDHFDGSA